MTELDLLLQRAPTFGPVTIGQLFEVVGPELKWLCFTAEDPIRERKDEPVAHWKIRGATAIPAGRYQIEITYSSRFKHDLPILIGVPGFVGVRIHPGNTSADTEGCILPGYHAITGMGVQQSRVAMALLYPKIKDALDASREVWIDIRNPVLPSTLPSQLPSESVPDRPLTGDSPTGPKFETRPSSSDI